MTPGLYDELISLARRASLELQDPRLKETAEVDAQDAHLRIAQFLEMAIAGILSRYRGAEALDKQQRLLERMINTIGQEMGPGEDLAQLRLAAPLTRLLAVYETVQQAQKTDHSARPDTPLAQSALLTGTRLDPSLASQLSKEIATADRVDILCSFIKWSGLRMILDALRSLTDRTSAQETPRLRVITTSYMGATDPKAIEELARLPNTCIRVSYDTQRTRLHAKAYLIHRNTGFSSGYVGSANLTRPALSEGLEWTTKISRHELPHLWEKMAGTFETYWQDDEFDSYDLANPEPLRLAIAREHGTSTAQSVPIGQFVLRPYPFQEEILDVLATERQLRDHHRHLVVAATGTGKTMIAAFDYARICRHERRRPSLLFVAHREEILRQALATFRAVLRDQNFGDLLAGGANPISEAHLFCSIQSYNSRHLYDRSPDAFAHVIVDEFHHAAAPGYKKLLGHMQPVELLGLTATPERHDELDILSFFDAAPTAEIRLPDAINRRLLCPFQYFGVSDSVDLSSLKWQRGGYAISELDGVYTGNDVRARLIVDKVRQLLLDPLRARGLGFCVSKAHAEFMARFFTDQGIASVALTADSPDELRANVQQRLVQREINFIFVVDLYNEGIDIPEVDTVLFLRPTESLTIYLQQLGRGLRLSDDKETLTVLDFIGAQRREFRFADRFRALSTLPTRNLAKEIEHEFPHLPSGCFVRLEKVARQRVLENINRNLNLQRPRIVRELTVWGRTLGRAPSLGEALDYLNTDLETLLKKGSWSQLLADAGLQQATDDPDRETLARSMSRLWHVDDLPRLNAWRALLQGDPGFDQSGDQQLTAMLGTALWGKVDQPDWNAQRAQQRLATNPGIVSDLMSLFNYLAGIATLGDTSTLFTDTPLRIGARYTKSEVLCALGHWSMERQPDMREGALHLAHRKLDVFFVTLQKTEEDYSPTTMYEDYVISPDLFHWQSQSSTSVQSPTGQRYIHHRDNGYTPLLVVRDTRKTIAGNTSPYWFLGPCDYVSHGGSSPISITWRLRHRVPMPLYRRLNQQMAA